MKILGLEGLDAAGLSAEVRQGGRFVIYQYCISLLVIMFKRASSIYFLRNGQSAVAKGLGFSLVSLLFGWGGCPGGRSIPSVRSSPMSAAART